jgi:hypothetical protein
MTSLITPRLIAIPFDSEIAKLTELFTGREWVFEEIDTWLNDKDERFFVLTGEPGVGKSAIAARLTQSHQNIAAYHFCIAGESGTIQPNGVLLSLAAQLVEYFPDYAETLANIVKPLRLSVKAEINAQTIKDSVVRGVVIENLYTQSPQETLDIVLRRSLANLPNPPEKPVLILVDSLDEAITHDAQENLITLLSGVSDLPTWVRLIVTTRLDEKRVLSYLKTLKPYFYHLDELSQKSLEDVHIYVGRRVSNETIQARLLSSQTDSQSLVEQITELSKGNFLYTKVLLDDIESGGQSLDDLDALPKSMDEFYHKFLMRLRSEWETKYQFIFGILTVTKATITTEELINLIANNPVIEHAPSETRLNQAVGVVKQFFTVERNAYGQETYRLFHQSFRDYLLDLNRNPIFWCSPKDAHRWIVEYCWQYHPDNWRECDRYGLYYFATHLIELASLEKRPNQSQDYVERLHGLLETEVDGQNAWFEAKNYIGDISGFLSDVALAWATADKELLQNLLVSTERRFRYALITSSLNSMAKNISLDLFISLVENKSWSPDTGLAYAVQIPEQERRLEALLSLAICSPATFIPKLFEATKGIPDNFYRAKALSLLTAYLPENLKNQALESALQTVQNIPDKKNRIFCQGQVLIWITPYLPDSLKNRTFELAQQIPDDRFRVVPLILIGSELPHPLKDEALEEALQLIEKTQDEQKDEFDIADLIRQISPHLPSKLILQALKVAQAIKDEYYRAGALAALISRLAVPLQIEIIDVAYKSALLVKDAEYRIRSLILMGNFLSEEQKRLTLEDIQAIKYESTKVELLTALLPSLKNHLIQDALDIVKTFRNSKVAIAITPYLSCSQMQQVVDLTQKLDSQSAAKVLLALSQHLPDSLVNQVFKIALDFDAPDDLATAMSGLSNYLPEDLMRKVWSLVTQKINALDNWKPTGGSSVDRDTHLALTMENLSNVASNLPDALKQLIFDKTLKLSSNTYREKILVKLLPSLPDSSRKIALQQALKSALAIEDTVYIARVLVEFTPYLDDSFKLEVFNTVDKISDESERTEVLIKLFPYIPEKHIPHAFSACAAVESESYRAEALTELIPYLPNSLKTEVLTKIRDIKSEYSQADALIKMIPSLSEPLKSQACELALDAISRMEDKQSLSHTIRELAPHQPESLMLRAFDLVQIIQPESDRLFTMTVLAPYLPATLKRKAYQIGLEIADEKVKIDFLIALIHHLPETLKSEAIQRVFKAASNISEAEHRAKSLAKLSPLLSQSLQSEALEQTLKSALEVEKIETLAELALLLPESLKVEAIEHALITLRKIKDERQRGIVLRKLCPNLTLPLLTQAFDINSSIIDEEYRLVAWGALVAKLPESMLSQAFNAALSIKGEVYRTKALRELILFLPEALIHRVYEVALLETNSRSRSSFLSKLVSRLTEPLKSRALHQCLTDVELAESENDQISILTELIPNLPKSLLLQTIRLTWSIRSEAKRAALLTNLIPQLEVLHPEDLSLILQETLHLSAEYSRQDLLINIQSLAPVIHASVGTEITAHIERVLLNIGRWWP